MVTLLPMLAVNLNSLQANPVLMTGHLETGLYGHSSR
jgi:hypothetical protein